MLPPGGLGLGPFGGEGVGKRIVIAGCTRRKEGQSPCGKDLKRKPRSPRIRLDGNLPRAAREDLKFHSGHGKTPKNTYKVFGQKRENAKGEKETGIQRP